MQQHRRLRLHRPEDLSRREFMFHIISNNKPVNHDVDHDGTQLRMWVTVGAYSTCGLRWEPIAQEAGALSPRLSRIDISITG